MKSSSKYKVFSGAIQFTIFIGVIIALLLAGLIMLQNTHTFFIQQSKATIENIQLANSGMNFLLTQNKQINDTLTLKELSDDNQKVQVQLSQWGIYEKAIVKTTHRKKTFYRAALLGVQMKTNNRPTLYLKDNFKPLVVVGKTVLKGTFFIPSQGIVPGYIGGESFYGQQLVDGTIKESGVSLPKLQKQYREGLELFLNDKKYSQYDFIADENMPKITNSFLKPIKVIYSKGIVELKNNELSGNIIVRSDVAIRVKNTAILKDIILMAPSIEIEDGLTGNFQAFANKKITIGKNCKLRYPSALILIQEKEKIVLANTNTFDYQINIDKASEIIGTVCFFKSIKENDFKPQFFLDEGSAIKGEVYCEGNFELKGKVVGSVFTEQFIANAVGSVFINHIYNGEIVDENFPERFCGILLEDNLKGIAKWIY